MPSVATALHEKEGFVNNLTSNPEHREQVAKWAEENAHKTAIVGSLTWAANNLCDALEAMATLEERNARLEKELDSGDSWAWIRAKFEKAKDKFRWYKPRRDSLIGTRYEVMGWLHCLFSEADPKVFIDITLEHQKRTDEAEAARDTLLDVVERVKGSMEVIPLGERPASWDCYIREFEVALKTVGR